MGNPADKEKKQTELLAIVTKGGPALARLIHARYKSQVDFGRASGMNASTVSRICKGVRGPSARSIPGICAALGTPLGPDVAMVLAAPTSKGLMRRIKQLASDLALERQTVTELRHEAHERRKEIKRLRKVLAAIAELSAGVP